MQKAVEEGRLTRADMLLSARRILKFISRME